MNRKTIAKSNTSYSRYSLCDVSFYNRPKDLTETKCRKCTPIQLESDTLQHRAGKPANGMRLNSNNVSLGWPEKWPDLSDDFSSGEWPKKWPEFVEGSVLDDVINKRLPQPLKKRTNSPEP